MDKDKCQCRIWDGINLTDDKQCSRYKKVGDFCNGHFKKGDRKSVV